MPQLQAQPQAISSGWKSTAELSFMSVASAGVTEFHAMVLLQESREYILNALEPSACFWVMMSKRPQRPCRQQTIRKDFPSRPCLYVIFKACYAIVTCKRTDYILRAKAQRRLRKSYCPASSADSSNEDTAFQLQKTRLTPSYISQTSRKINGLPDFFSVFSCYNSILKWVKFNVIHFPESKCFLWCIRSTE